MVHVHVTLLKAVECFCFISARDPTQNFHFEFTSLLELKSGLQMFLSPLLQGRINWNYNLGAFLEEQ